MKILSINLYLHNKVIQFIVQYLIQLLVQKWNGQFITYKKR